MTTATNPGNYVDFDEYVGLKLEKTRSTIRTTDLLTALAGVAAMFLGYLLIFVVLDQWVVRGGFGVAWRWVLLSTLMTSTIAWLVWKIGVPSFRVINGLFAAREIEKAEPGLKSNLLNLIDLKATGRPINPSIRIAMERQAAIRLQHVDVSHAIDHRPLVRTAYVLLAVIVIFCFYALFSPKKISNSIWRSLLPAAEVPLATVTEILDVKPGDMTVQAHQPFVDVQVDLAGEIPAQVLLLYSTADGKQDQPIELRPDQQGETRFKGQLIGEGIQGLMYDVTYFIRAGDAVSKQYKITVEQPPYAEVESVRIEFPSYMKLQPIEQVNNGGIDAWEGAKVLISAKTNMPVRSAMIQFLDDPQAGPTGEEIPMTVVGAGKHLQAHWTLALRSDGSFPKYYRIHCRTEDGRATTGHVLNPLTIRPDLPPEVVLMHPERDVDAPKNAVIAILAQAKDPDFELGYLYLNVEKAGQKIVHDVLSEGRQPKLTIKHDLSLVKLNAAVGDVFEIWIEAYDNKQPRPNSKNTPKVKIRVTEAVSQKQAQEQLAEQKERVEQKLAEADQETNSDQADAPRPMDGDPKDRQPQNGDRQEEANDKPTPNPPEEKPLDEQRGQQQKDQQRQGTNQKQTGDKQQGSGQQNGSKKAAPGDSQNDSSRNQSDPGSKSDSGSKSDKPLPSDGSQDDAVLQRLNELINKNNQSKPDESNNRPSEENPQPASDQAQPDKKQQSAKDKSKNEKGTGADNEKSEANPDGKQSDATEAAKPGVKDPKQKPGSKDDSNTPNDPSSEPKPDASLKDKDPSDQKTPNTDTKNEKSSDGSRAKTSTKNADGEKNDKDTLGDPAQNPEKSEKDRTAKKPSVDPEKNPSEKPDRTKRDDANSGEKTGEKKEGDQADGSKPDAKQKDESSDSSSNSSRDKPDSSNKENGTEKSSNTKPEKKDDGQSGAKSGDKADKSDSQADSPANENLPSGQNPKSTKESSKEKGTAKPKNDSNNSGSKPDGPREQTADSPDAKKEPGDGTEKGVAKPDRDPKAKPSPTKNENVKRDPNEKPETRPGQSPDDSSSEKPDRADKSKRDGDKSKPVPRNDDSKDPPSPDSIDKTQDQTDGKQSGSKSDKDGKAQGKGRESDKDSNDASGQKSGEKQDSANKKSNPSASKQAEGSQDGDKSESDKDSASKPDSGQSGGKQSGNEKKSGQPDKQSGSSNEKKSGDKATGDKKSTDSKQKKDQSGGDNKSDDKSSDAASDKSDKAESGKSESGKSESEGGKGDGKEQGAGKGGKSNGKPGQKPSTSPPSPNTQGGNGGANGDGAVAAPTQGGDVAPTEQSDDANLEYNKQATELILQKLKKDLDRGEVDPELLEQLGWTKAEMKQFADRMSKSLSESKLADETAEGKARQQQFQEMLKNLNMQKTGAQRGGAKEPKRDVEQVDSKRTPPPPAYRSVYEKWTREMARQKPAKKE